VATTIPTEILKAKNNIITIPVYSDNMHPSKNLAVSLTQDFYNLPCGANLKIGAVDHKNLLKNQRLNRNQKTSKNYEK
jgi:hypothetical protein